jgi:predicted CXXCH cytochrome family protein
MDHMPFGVWKKTSAQRLPAGLCMIVVLLVSARRVEAQTAVNGCVTCHAAQTDPRLAAPAALFTQPDVHRENGFACVDCHGGSASSAEARVAHAPAQGFKGKPTGQAQIATCARCHNDASLMQRYAPQPRVGQAADYAASVHGQRLAKGDLNVATCASCHNAHGIRRVKDTKSPGSACGTCHAMFAQRFAASVHQPIFDKGCVECHGNHAVVEPSEQMLSAAAGGVCAACHTAGDAGDKGAAAAVVLRAGIDRLKTAIDESGSLIQRIGNAGIEVSNEQLALREAATKLTLARTEMHGFDVAVVEAILADGMKVVASVDSAGQKGVAELRFRRRGLAASLGAILFFVVALGLKIRQIDRHDQERRATPAG